MHITLEFGVHALFYTAGHFESARLAYKRSTPAKS